MLRDLIKQQEKLQPFLKRGDYTFIAPSNSDLFGEYIKLASRIAPVTSFNSSIHEALSNEESGRVALSNFPSGTPIRIYVINAGADDSFLMHSSIEDYCKDNNINLPTD
jgi:hypothetical protein